MTECVTCQRPVDGTAYGCQHCADRTGEWLTRAAGLVVDALEAAAGLVRYGSRGPRGGIDPPMLGNPAAADRLAHAGTTITTWARRVAEERGQELPVPDRRAGEHPVAVAATWLVGQLDWLRHRSYAEEALGGLEAAARTIVRGADRPPEQVIVGACECGTALYAIAGAATATCRACGAKWDVERSRDILRKHLDGMLATAAEIAVMALHLHPDARRHKVRHLINVWASRTQITRRGLSRDGSPTYRVGEVLARLDPLLSKPEREAS